MDDGSFRVSVLAEPKIQTWEARALKKLTEQAGVEIPLVVVNEGEREDAEYEDSLENPTGIGLNDIELFFQSLRKERAWTLVHVERKLSWMIGGPSKRWKLTRTQLIEDLSCLSDSTFEYVDPISSREGWNELPEDVAAEVGEHSDVAVRFGFGLIEGSVLTAPEHGVISFHPADVRKYRGLGPSLAYLNDDDDAGLTLQRLNDSVDAGEIVAFDTVDISDAHSLDNVVGRINDRGTDLLTEGVQNLQRESFSPETVEELGEYRYVSERTQLSYATRILLKNLRGRVSRVV